MASKEVLLKKLMSKPMPSSFTIRDLDSLMSKCKCKKFSGGRGSAIKYVHEETGRVLEFDAPHPGKDLYRYHVKAVIRFLVSIGEVIE